MKNPPLLNPPGDLPPNRANIAPRALTIGRATQDASPLSMASAPSGLGEFTTDAIDWFPLPAEEEAPQCEPRGSDICPDIDTWTNEIVHVRDCLRSAGLLLSPDRVPDPLLFGEESYETI